MYLVELHQKYEERKWIEIASRFFDRTGQHLDPEMLKEKFEGS